MELLITAERMLTRCDDPTQPTNGYMHNPATKVTESSVNAAYRNCGANENAKKRKPRLQTRKEIVCLTSAQVSIV